MRGLAPALLLAAACTTTIVPPAAPEDPVTVYLVDWGRHASLVLPRPDGGHVEYAYGEWDWFALNRTGLFRALAAVLWPTRGTLGRAQAARPPEGAGVYPLRVGRVEAGRLLARLDAAFEARRGTLVENERRGLSFVHSDLSYTGCRNSNRAAADWLEELGCGVRGPRVLSKWRVERP